MNYIRKSFWLYFIVSIFLLGCSKETKQKSVIDTPETHYKMGKSLLEKENYTSALREFQLSNKLKESYIPAYEGLALAYLGLGELENAEESAKKGVGKGDKFAPVYVAYGKVQHALGKYDKAIEFFKGAVKIDKNSTDALNSLGFTYSHMGEYDKARESYESVLSMDPTNKVADSGLEELSRLLRASAGMPIQYINIAKKASITKAELAALYVNELPLDKIFRKAPKQESTEFRTPGEKKKKDTLNANLDIVDLPDDHWAKSFVEMVTEKGIMEIAPDGTFRPDEKLTKLTFAQLIQHFLEKAFNDPSLPTKYIGTTSPFADISGSHYAFNAVMTSSSRGIIPGKTDGTFGVSDKVSGTDALLIMKKIQAQF